MTELIKMLAKLNDDEVNSVQKFIRLLLYMRTNPNTLEYIESMEYDAYNANKAVSEELKALRNSLGLSVNKIAELVYVDRRTWQRYEDGIACPTVSEYQRFFYVLNRELITINSMSLNKK